MVLAGLNKEISEAELRQICDCTIFGTEALQAVEAARGLGFVRTKKENLTIAELVKILDNGLYPIVYLGLMPLNQAHGTHALVVLEISLTHVTVLDPLLGKQELASSDFEAAFRLTNGLTILVS